MAKLRVIRERKLNSEDFPTDLRGLGDPDLFNQSKLTTQLWIAHTTPQSVESIITGYGLHQSERTPYPPDPELICLETDTHQEGGGHKLQAVSLFFSAIELCAKSENTKCFIRIHNGLRNTLAERLEGYSQSATINHNEDIDAWRSSDARLSLGAPITLFLQQAGLPISASEGTLYLDNKSLYQLHEEISRNHAESEEKRKSR